MTISKDTKLVVKIVNGLFKSSLVKNSKPVFPNKIQHFQINRKEKWVIWGPAKSLFANVLSNKYLNDPPTSLKYGNSCNKHKSGDAVGFNVQQVQFKGVEPTAHLSARYEYFKDDFDRTCKQFILDNAIGSNQVSYDVVTTSRKVNMELYETLIETLKLKDLEDRWIMGLSNGQMRRARLAHTLLKEPDLLIVDDPFLGLDSEATTVISEFLSSYEEKRLNNSGCSVVIGLRVQDEIPEWCTHIVYVTETGIEFQGPIGENIDNIMKVKQELIVSEIENESDEDDRALLEIIKGHSLYGLDEEVIKKMPKALEFKGVSVSYKGCKILEDINWGVEIGSKWQIVGHNGSGKSTLISLITADHPQGWNSRIVENGIVRKTGKSNYFDINKKIGMTSPELHSMVIKKYGDELRIIDLLSSGKHDDSSSNFTKNWDKMGEDEATDVVRYIEYFKVGEMLNERGLKVESKFNELSVSEQKYILFIRSLMKRPEILILDEAFSGMESKHMNKCFKALSVWPGTVLVISHIDRETPKACITNTITLVSPGEYKVE
ncbi:hypothetical protein Kpol_1002p105 [Vanderwaltozyma polyspora DSM 70294]|uniref:ABC transporter domain-containing protein n=1 Tax=Vanderwaltozyma polyspora (strain ATCC 22028 / DSM 70294 / BCRC 21397 / CBS 2163 / NBRC 10782 / NRRL Y-8283 / UCD 57-17) TaxID=436907 RepID=A7TED4_VANPO|nr:uncharacterized protein Kpol_1002p105 [Vanderwaltozyma polyspora DSM 70294]EDO19456.1 hypothetical protein Kpol_1002p105 [Vanderwaltozyma polyspora DSM 70294]